MTGRPRRPFEPIEPRQFHEADGVEDWRVVGEGACACFRAGSFAAAARLVQAIAELPDLEPPPDVDLRGGDVTVRLITIEPGYYGLSRRDLELARRISATALELGVPADPSPAQNIQISIDGLVGPDVVPFWRTVLGYQDRGDDPGELIDPRARGPVTYFQQQSAPPDGAPPQRGRIHLDVWVAHDQADARIAAAIAAGGRVVTDRSPTWTTLEDAEGNRVCVCTWRSRD